MTPLTTDHPAEAAAAPATTALEVRGVTKRYGSATAVDDVSFALGRGEFLTMLGPSGSGKTTTLRMIAGFVRPDRGAIVVGGTDLSQTPAHRRNMGMVFQNYALFPHMTAAQNVSFPLEMRGRSRKEARASVDRALELVGLGALGGRRPSELSGGQQQRVAVARAVVFEPDVLLMDEPLGALDRKLRGTMQTELLRIARETNATVVTVTHDQEEALVMSDRIAIYDQGRIQQLGTAPELYERPASLFVADFIGESNILRGTVDRTGTDVRVVGDTWVADAAAGAVPVDLADGAPAAVVVRPEQLRIAPGIDDRAARNTLTGTVIESVYLGSELKHHVRVGQGELEVRVPRSAGLGAFAHDAPVTLSWRPEDAVVLADDRPAG